MTVSIKSRKQVVLLCHTAAVGYTSPCLEREHSRKPDLLLMATKTNDVVHS